MVEMTGLLIGSNSTHLKIFNLKLYGIMKIVLKQSLQLKDTFFENLT